MSADNQSPPNPVVDRPRVVVQRVDIAGQVFLNAAGLAEFMREVFSVVPNHPLASAMTDLKDAVGATIANAALHDLTDGERFRHAVNNLVSEAKEEEARAWAFERRRLLRLVWVLVVCLAFAGLTILALGLLQLRALQALGRP